ncbi:hypothetical protein [uncultured Chryseobacterium sp.]|uniref:hypothetical protein n=1 Tax=uncultured Chryseobacterium sp. TaxID=259322 RepID=UPI00263522E4|nr:hypothetical protein [uncultured Chryseobacterium sp.]
MAIEQCNISFNINYTSSHPVTSATASYRIKGSGDPYTVYTINPVPASGGLVTLPAILANGEYELIVEVAASGVVDVEKSSFKIGDCGDSVCAVPFIKTVTVQENGQIVMDYVVDTENLETPEYQIAKDPGFKEIVHFKVGYDYTPTENVYMRGGNIPNDTLLYIRARKHCLSPYGVSDWSNVMEFRSGRWISVKAPYVFEDAYCVSGKYKNPVDSNEVGASICWSEGTLRKTINLTTPIPQEGSLIYLSDGNTPAIPENLGSFDTDGASSGFKEMGIKWVRFGSYEDGRIFNVEPSTGLIRDFSSFNCDK